MAFEANDIKETEDEWIIPAITTLQGVQNKKFKSADEIEMAIPWMNNKPFVVDHPRDNEGNLTSVGRFPEAIQGYMDDAHFLKDGNRAKVKVHLFKSDPRNLPIVAEVKENNPVSVSLGYYAKAIPMDGKHNGREFRALEKDIYVDHLALVPKGACSWEDGCGLNLNQKIEGDNVNAEEIAEKVACKLKALIKANDSHPAGDPPEDKRTMEANKVTEELEKKVKLLGDEAETLRTENKGLNEKIGALETEKADLSANLKKVSDELASFKADEEKALKDKKDALITDIVKVNGKEPDIYESWNMEQLTELGETLKGNTDYTAKGSRPSTHEGQVGFRFDHDKDAWVEG